MQFIYLCVILYMMRECSNDLENKNSGMLKLLFVCEYIDVEVKYFIQITWLLDK